jgi:two-component system, OmpR family, response regulator
VGRLLVVEDEERIRRLLLHVLQAAGFTVDAASTGADGLGKARAYGYDLVILDLMLPDIPGADVLAEMLAHQPATRVLVLSAAPEIGLRVRVLDMGALDFLPKPFAIAELLARVRARLRDTATEAHRRFLQVGDLRLDTLRRTFLAAGRSVPLSQQEFVLLNHLMLHAGQVCSRGELLTNVWGYNFDPGSNVVDVYIRRLRAKLHVKNLIETVRNVGYCLTAG